MAVSDGSYKDGCGTAAWILFSPTSKDKIQGYTTLPGSADDQYSFQSELGGLYSFVRMVKRLCHYNQISHDTVHFGCNGLGPLQCCFNPTWEPLPTTPHFDLISAICNFLSDLPVSWMWQHIWAHQDKTKPHTNLSVWELLNIQMDTKHKHW